MWKVYVGDQYQYYVDYQEAKERFRQTIKESVGSGGLGKIMKSIDSSFQKYLGDSIPGISGKIKTSYGISEYIKVIDSYCNKYYGSTVPRQFEALKSFLVQYVTDTNYPADPEHFEFEAFEDANVSFYITNPSKILHINVKNKDAQEQFLTGKISIWLPEKSDEHVFSLRYEHLYWNFRKLCAEEFKLIKEADWNNQNDYSNNKGIEKTTETAKATGNNQTQNTKEKPYTVENFTSGKSYTYATERGAKNKMRAIVATEFGTEGIAKITNLIDRYCKTQYPDGTPKQLEELKTILTKLVTDPQFPSDPDQEMDMVFEDDNLEIYTLPIDGTLSIQITNPKMKTKFPEANIIVNASSAKELTFILDNGRDAETDPKYVGIDVEVFDEEFEEMIHELNLDSPAGSVIGTACYSPSYAPQNMETEYVVSGAPIGDRPQRAQGLAAFERAELNGAKARYDKAVDRVKMHPNSRSIYEAEEKKAHADYMQALSKSAVREAGAAKGQPLRAWERAELNQAKARYDKAIAERKRHPESDRIYESLEKKAYSDYMRIMAKYAGRE